MKQIIAIILVVVFAAAACNKNKTETATGADATAEADVNAMEELKGISAELTAQVDLIMSPINEVDTLVDELTQMPAKLNVNAEALMNLCKCSFDGQSVSVDAEFTADAAVKAEVEALLAKIVIIKADLEATPDKVTQLAGLTTESVAKVPVLATKAQTSAQAKLANPFAKEEDKAQAQADLDAVVSVKADAEASIEDAKAKATELPQLATSALAKLTASFATGASTEG